MEETAAFGIGILVGAPSAERVLEERQASAPAGPVKSDLSQADIQGRTVRSEGHQEGIERDDSTPRGECSCRGHEEVHLGLEHVMLVPWIEPRW